MQNAHIQLNNISHSFRSKNTSNTIFDKLDLAIERNTFVALLGPSGCGKSTLLRVISGLLQPEQGEIKIDAAAIVSPSEQVSFMFQKPTLLPWLTVIDNVLFPLKHRHGRVSAADRDRADSLLTLTGLTDRKSAHPHQLSGGMQQRVAIARALMQNNEVMLMDEPFSALDAMNREKIGFELLKMLQPSPKTIVFVTHSIQEAVMLADRVIVLGAHASGVVDDISIQLPAPRSIQSLELPEFGKYCHQIRQYFYQNEHGSSTSDAPSSSSSSAPGATHA